MKRTHSRESLINDLQTYHNETGKIPGRGNTNIPRGSIYVRVFGSWNEALRAAGFDNTRQEEIKAKQAQPTKVCSSCNIKKSSTEFKLQFICDACRSTYRKEWYEANKETHKACAISRNAQRRQVFNKWKASLECYHCGEKFPGCLHFHHIGADKDFVIAVHFNRVSVETLGNELSKCGVLCGNCHVKVHAGLLSEPPHLSDSIIEELSIAYNKHKNIIL